MRVETLPYSRLRLGAEPYEPEFVSPNRIDIYLALSDRIIKCKTGDHPSFLPIQKLSKYQHATKETMKFNDVVYNENAAYAITYRQQGQVKTAIIDKSGFICRGWDFRMNMIPSTSMATKDHVRQLLVEIQFDKVVEWFAVDDLGKSNALQATRETHAPEHGR